MEEKWGRMVSRRTPPPTKEGDETLADAGSGSWAEKVGRKDKKKPLSPTGQTNPDSGDRERGGESTRPPKTACSGAQKAPKRGVPGPRRAGRKGWPTLPKMAVVAISPIPGGTSTGVELIREAQNALSLEEMEIPPLEMKRSRTGGYLLGLRG